MSPGGGISTLSITWITPLEAGTSARVTAAPSAPTVTVPSATVTVSLSPFAATTVFAPSARALDGITPGTTWWRRMSARAAISSGVSNESRSIPAAANASSLGANTVYSVSPLRVVTKSAAVSAATRDVWIVVAPAVIAMLTAGVHMYAPHSAALMLDTACVTVL